MKKELLHSGPIFSLARSLALLSSPLLSLSLYVCERVAIYKSTNKEGGKGGGVDIYVDIQI